MAGRRKTSRFKNRLLGKKAMDIKEMKLAGIEVEKQPGGTELLAVFKGVNKVAVWVEPMPRRSGELQYVYKARIGDTEYTTAHYDFDILWEEARRVAAGEDPNALGGVQR